MRDPCWSGSRWVHLCFFFQYTVQDGTAIVLALFLLFFILFYSDVELLQPLYKITM